MSYWKNYIRLLKKNILQKGTVADLGAVLTFWEEIVFSSLMGSAVW